MLAWCILPAIQTYLALIQPLVHGAGTLDLEDPDLDILPPPGEAAHADPGVRAEHQVPHRHHLHRAEPQP